MFFILIFVLIILLLIIPINFIFLNFILIFLIYYFVFNFNFLILFLFLPLLNSILIYFFFKNYLKKKIILFCLFFNIFLIFLKSSFILIYFLLNLNLNLNLNFIYYLNLTNYSELIFFFNFDILTIIMIFTISFISFLVHLYSIDYMLFDKNQINFLIILNLFTFFMLFLIISGSTLQLFIGQEGVGITSYLLINFQYNRFEANKSSLKALTLNKIGDISLLLFIGINYYFFETFEINNLKIYLFLFFNTFFLNINYFLIFLISLLLFIGAIAKSAQLGLHTQLPDATEGPTPVSALLHAATMVTAGIYLLVRFNFLINLIPEILYLILIFGALTALIGSLFALIQNDIKKIIAFSTLSQLGYMFTAIGFSSYNFAMFHLFTHAPFKALLSLSAGIIIHNFNNNQDLRKYGNLINLMPILYIFNLSGNLALIGFPFFSGYYSKDLIIELTLLFSLNNFFYFLISFCLNFGAFLTVIYSIRLVFYSFFTKLNNLNFLINLKLIKDLNFIQFQSLILLVFGSIFFGYFFFNYFVGFYSFFFQQNTLLNFFPLILIENLPLNLKIIPLIIFFFALILSFFRYFNFFKNKNNKIILSNLNYSILALIFLIIKFYFNLNFLIFLKLIIFLFLINLIKFNNIYYFLFFFLNFLNLTFLNLNLLILLIFFFFLINFNKFENLLNFYFSKFIQKKLFFDIFLNRIFAIPLYLIYYFFFFYLIDKGILQNLIEFFSLKFNLKLKKLNLNRINFNLFENKLKKNLYFYYLLIFIFVIFFIFNLFNLKKNVFFNLFY